MIICGLPDSLSPHRHQIDQAVKRALPVYARFVRSMDVIDGLKMFTLHARKKSRFQFGRWRFRLTDKLWSKLHERGALLKKMLQELII